MRPPRPRLAALALTLLVVLGSSPAQGTQAAFSDRAPLTTGAFTAATINPVTGLTCTNTGADRITLSWTPQTNRSYWLQVFQGTSRRVSIVTSASSVELTVGNLNLLESGRHRATVTTLARTTNSWMSATSPEIAFNAVLGLSLRCA